MWVKYDDNYEVSYDGHIRNSRTKKNTTRIRRERWISSNPIRR